MVHRSQGTLEAELKRAKTLKGVRADAWQLALYRASGNLEAARDAATAGGTGGDDDAPQTTRIPRLARIVSLAVVSGLRTGAPNMLWRKPHMATKLKRF